MEASRVLQEGFYSFGSQVSVKEKQQIQAPIHWNYKLNQTQFRICYKGSVSHAFSVLDEIPVSDLFTWNSLMRTHLSNGDHENVKLIYWEMLRRGIRPDKYTLPCILRASGFSGELFYGKQVHAHALKLGYGSDDYVITALMTMYGFSDSIETARHVFEQSSSRNPVSWTLLATLYTTNDQLHLALKVFEEMTLSGIQIDPVALAAALGVCWHLKSLRHGRKIHEIARINGMEFDLLVSNSLVKMYLACDSINEARVVFDSIPKRDVVSWTAIIGGYVKKGGFNEGLKLFRTMQLEHIKCDPFSVSSILPACARISAQKNGKEVHGYIIRSLLASNLTVQNALIDMYSKSGNLDSAVAIFSQMEIKDIVTWTVMILAYSLHGQGELGVELFRKMEKESKLIPDDFTYVSALHACNTARLVEDGQYCFSCIKSPTDEHFALMVSLLSRANLFDNARAFIQNHNLEGSVQVQRALLDGCRIHRNTTLGKRVVEKLIQLEPLHAENYVLLSNIYASYGKWAMSERALETIEDMGLSKRKAYSWIEVRLKVHAFSIEDFSHPKSERIYWELKSLMKIISGEDDTVLSGDLSLHDVIEENGNPCEHSEMMAIAFGLISTPAKATIHVTKNLRMCRSCHSFAKMISKLVKREIILKDPDRFHHFRYGFCSCDDFW